MTISFTYFTYLVKPSAWSTGSVNMIPTFSSFKLGITFRTQSIAVVTLSSVRTINKVLLTGLFSFKICFKEPKAVTPHFYQIGFSHSHTIYNSPPCIPLSFNSSSKSSIFSVSFKTTTNIFTTHPLPPQLPIIFHLIL